MHPLARIDQYVPVWNGARKLGTRNPYGTGEYDSTLWPKRPMQNPAESWQSSQEEVRREFFESSPGVSSPG